MSIYCQKCGTENEDGAKFCKSCGTPLSVEPIQPDNTNSTSTGNTFQLVKKIVIWIVGIFVGIVLIAVFIEFTQAKRQDGKIRDLRSACANKDAQACYKLGTEYFSYSSFSSEESPDVDEKSEALARGCQLESKDACREGGYYLQACGLKDGESCYLYSQKILSLQGIEGSVACGSNSASEECRIARELNKNDAERYKKLACEYGYSQGCMEQ